MFSPSRREWLVGVAATAALPGLLSTARAAGRAPALRVAHITDVHITKDRDAAKGVAALFAHMFGQKRLEAGAGALEPAIRSWRWTAR